MKERYLMILIEGEEVMFYDKASGTNITVPWEDVDLYIYASDKEDTESEDSE
jgi:hypothetical protein